MNDQRRPVRLEIVVRGLSPTREILAAASKRTEDLGIELLDLRFKRINYVEGVRKDVFPVNWIS